MKRGITLSGIIVLLALAATPQSAAGTKPTLTAEQTILAERIKDHIRNTFGAYGEKIVSNPHFTFEPRTIAWALRREKTSVQPPHKRKPKSDYDYVVNPEAIKAGLAFLKEHEKFFARVGAQFDIEPEYFAGTFDAESSFGEGSTGDYPVLDTLFTIYVFMPKFQEKKIDPRDGAWSEDEIDSFLRMCERYRRDPFIEFGSRTGAQGIPQFEPTSYEKFAMHFDGNLCLPRTLSPTPPDLTELEDATCSMANYFHAYWGKTDQEKRAAFMAYNPDPRYGDAIRDATDCFQGHPPVHPRYTLTLNRSARAKSAHAATKSHPKKVALFF